MIRTSLLFVFCLLATSILIAGNGYEIKVQIDGFSGDEAYLGYYLMDKQYILDTANVNQDGMIVFRGEEPLKGGVYLLIMPPDNQYFPVLVSQGEQQFYIHTKMENLIGDMEIRNSQDNQLYYEYMNFLSKKIPVRDELLEDLKKAEGQEEKEKEIKDKLEMLNVEVKRYHEDLVKKYPSSLSSLIARSRIEVEEPAFTGTEEEIKMKRYYFYKDHWFDHFDLSDPRMLRTPELYKRIEYYLENLTPKIPDSISVALDRILSMMDQNEETFKYYLSHFLNTYAKSKIVGMDAVYVHLVEQYYEAGRAPWIDEENLKKIIDNAKTLKPILVGKIAPNIQLVQKDNSPIRLHDVKSKYTLLIFWEPDCGHCQKTMPVLKEVYEKFRPQGLEVFAVCTKKYDKDKQFEEVEKCWKFLEENEMTQWINTVDPFIRSRYAQIYDIRSTPRIFILNENKEIIVKGIGKEQLEEVMDQIIQSDREKLKK